MLSVLATIQGNTVIATDELLRQYDGQTVTIYVAENKDINLKTQLDALRTYSKSSWGQDAQDYVNDLRSEDRVF